MQTATGTDAAALFGDFFGRIDAAIALIAEAMRPAIARFEAFMERMSEAYRETLSRAGMIDSADAGCSIDLTKPVLATIVATDELRSGAAGRRDPSHPATLPPALREVWELLDGRALSAKEIAQKLGMGMTEGSVYKRIRRLRALGYEIANQRALGFWRPDRPPSP